MYSVSKNLGVCFSQELIQPNRVHGTVDMANQNGHVDGPERCDPKPAEYVQRVDGVARLPCRVFYRIVRWRLWPHATPVPLTVRRRDREQVAPVLRRKVDEAMRVGRMLQRRVRGAIPACRPRTSAEAVRFQAQPA